MQGTGHRVKIALDRLKIGDRMRFSTELLQEIEDNPYHRSQLVEIVKIDEDVTDGTKTVYVSNVQNSNR